MLLFYISIMYCLMAYLILDFFFNPQRTVLQIILYSPQRTISKCLKIKLKCHIPDTLNEGILTLKKIT